MRRPLMLICTCLLASAALDGPARAQPVQPPTSYPIPYAPPYVPPPPDPALAPPSPPVPPPPPPRTQPPPRQGRSIEVPPFATYREQDAYGISFSVFGNLSRGGGMHGLSLAGVANVHDQGGAGFHLAGLINLHGGHFRGLQLALANSAHDLTGVQFSPTVNVSSGNVVGLQWGVVNYNSYATGQFSGLQASLANVAGSANGLQLGVVNVAHRVRGVQFGLINYARQLSGVQIGLVNIHLGNRIMPGMIILNIGTNR